MGGPSASFLLGSALSRLARAWLSRPSRVELSNRRALRAAARRRDDPFLPVLLVPAIGGVVVGLGVFLYFEWKSQRLANAPRLWMALGTSLLSASFLFVSPVRVFMAFAFSHAVEYMVFVWAFQRRRYRKPLGHDPALGRVLRHPWLAYGVFTFAVTAPYLLVRFWGYLIVPRRRTRPFSARRSSVGRLLERLPVARPLLLRRILVEDALAVGAPLLILVALASEAELDARHHRSGQAGSRAGRATRHDVGVVREVLNAREDAQVFRDVELAENVHYE